MCYSAVYQVFLAIEEVLVRNGRSRKATTEEGLVVTVSRDGKEVMSQAVPSSHGILLLGSCPDEVQQTNKLSIAVTGASGGPSVGTLEVSVADLFDYGPSGGLFSTRNGAAQVWMSCFSPLESDAVSTQFRTLLDVVDVSAISSSPLVENRILVHVMDGLGCPFKNKSNLMVRCEIWEYGEGVDSERSLVSSVSTSSSTHLRQLVWDQKVVMELPFRLPDMPTLPPGARFLLRVVLLRPSIDSSSSTGAEVVAEADRDLIDLLGAIMPKRLRGGDGHKQGEVQVVVALQLKPEHVSAESSKFSTTSSTAVRIRLGLIVPNESQVAAITQDLHNRSKSYALVILVLFAKTGNVVVLTEDEVAKEAESAPPVSVPDKVSVDSEDTQLNNMMKGKTLALYDSIFGSGNRQQVISAEAFVEFCRLHVTEKCAREADAIVKRASSPSYGEVDLPYVMDLQSSVVNATDTGMGSWDIDVSGGRRFVDGYLSINPIPLATRTATFDKMAAPINSEVLKRKIATMSVTVAESELVVTAITNIFLGGSPKDASHISRYSFIRIGLVVSTSLMWHFDYIMQGPSISC